MEISGSSKDLITIFEVAHPRSDSSSILFLVKLEFGNAGFWEEENHSNRRKTSRSKEENHHQTQPTYHGVDAGIWTLGTNWWKASALPLPHPRFPVLVNSLSQVVSHP